MARPQVAFFDLDRTLIDVNSGLLWAAHERRAGNISALQMARAAFWSGMYHFALIDMQTAIERALQHYQGVASELLEERTRSWFAASIESRLRPGAKRAIEHHRSRGHKLVILTNSSCYEARAASEAWSFDDFLANTFELDARGCLTGRFHPPLCYGEGKVERAIAWSEERGLDARESYFYSDSYSDAPMLDYVAEPRVVSPDPRLRRLARKRRWEILTW